MNWDIVLVVAIVLVVIWALRQSKGRGQPNAQQPPTPPTVSVSGVSTTARDRLARAQARAGTTPSPVLGARGSNTPQDGDGDG